MLRSFASWSILAASGLAAFIHSSDARACGGGSFYSVASQQESTAVSGHAVVVSMSTKRTVLWDRVTYSGAPGEFAWVMPVPSGSALEIASAAWIESVVGGTTPVVVSPEAECFEGGGDGDAHVGGCCGSADAAGGNFDGAGGGGTRGAGSEREVVTVVHSEEVGPYDTKIIKSDTPGAIGKWLTDNGYAIPAGAQAILDDYAAKGLEFIALRLKAGAGIKDMQPVRVVMPGGLTTFPMRMLGVGAKDKVAIQLAVIAEGRYEAKGFANAVVDPAKVSWDFDAGKSDYATQRAALLAGNGGVTWLSLFAQKSGLLSPGADTFALGTGETHATLASLYFDRAAEIGEGSACPTSGIEGLAASGGEVVALCADKTMPCSQLGAGQIDSAKLACGALDDLSAALVGLHPKDVWVTRLEAELPVAALAQDLTLVPALGQAPLSHVVPADDEHHGDPCNAAASAALSTPKRSRRAAAPLGVMAFGIAMAFIRKASRKRR